MGYVEVVRFSWRNNLVYSIVYSIALALDGGGGLLPFLKFLKFLKSPAHGVSSVWMTMYSTAMAL